MRYDNIVLFLSALFFGTSCGTNLREKAEKTEINPVSTTEAAPTNKETYISPEDFAKLTVREQWSRLSPQRRNYLRENPNIYPQFKPIIAEQPDMEEVPASPTNSPQNTHQKPK